MRLVDHLFDRLLHQRKDVRLFAGDRILKNGHVLRQRLSNRDRHVRIDRFRHHIVLQVRRMLAIVVDLWPVIGRHLDVVVRSILKVALIRRPLMLLMIHLMINVCQRMQIGQALGGGA